MTALIESQAFTVCRYEAAMVWQNLSRNYENNRERPTIFDGSWFGSNFSDSLCDLAGANDDDDAAWRRNKGPEQRTK